MEIKYSLFLIKGGGMYTFTLYEQTVAKPDVAVEDAVENIDIGELYM